MRAKLDRVYVDTRIRPIFAAEHAMHLCVILPESTPVYLGIDIDPKLETSGLVQELAQMPTNTSIRMTLDKGQILYAAVASGYAQVGLLSQEATLEG